MTKRREPLRTATRKPPAPLSSEVRDIQRIAAGIGFRHGILPAIVDLQVLREEVDSLEVKAVAMARASGRSWTEIGDALGVSRQAARERFSPVVGSAGGS